MGGQQPVTASQIQLYAVGTTGDGSNATALLQSSVTTSDGSGNASNSNANAGNAQNTLPAGAFLLTNLYSCPSQTTPVYIVATGGNAGAGNNSGLVEMAAIGPCGVLTRSTTININEVTTVAAVSALAPFAASATAIGSSPSDASALLSAFALAAQLADATTGATPGVTPAPGTVIPANTLRALANTVAACVNSAGGTANDGSICGTLFALATPSAGTAPTNTVDALRNIVANPASNAAALFALANAASPFQPSLSTAPASWALVPSQTVTPAPFISPASGSYLGTQSVVLADAVPGAVIHFTTDGSTPSAASPVYTGAFTTASSATVQAVAIAQGLSASPASVSNLSIAAPPSTYSADLDGTTMFVGASTMAFWPLPQHRVAYAGYLCSEVAGPFSTSGLHTGATRVVINCGFNDVDRNVAGQPAEAIAAIDSMATLAAQSGMRVIIGTVQRPNPNGSLASIAPGIDALDDAIRQYAASHGYTLVDFAPIFIGHPELYTDDIHPNTAGYVQMEALLSSTVTY